MNMKLIKPFPIIGQGFGANAVPIYSGQGLRGHSGLDFGSNWGDPIKCAVDSYCYSVMNRNNPKLMAYRAVFTLVDDGDVTYEVSYGHCSTIFAVPGKTYKAGDILALVGNTGDVFAGATYVTEADKQSGNHAGAHLHFQVRIVKKVPISEATDPTTQYIMDGNGIYSKDGYYYSVPDFNNGENGCIDPEPFFDLSTPPAKDLLLSARLEIVGNQMMATNPKQAKIVLAVASLLKAFNS